MENTSETEVENAFGSLYDQDFLSYRPIVNADDEERVEYISKKMVDHVMSSDFIARYDGRRVSTAQIMDDYVEETDQLIGDDDFAGLLNADGEIQIADSIYKYTPTGLYIVD